MNVVILHPEIDTFGGAERVVLRIAQFLASLNHDVKVLTTSYKADRTYEGFRQLDVEVFKSIPKSIHLLEPYCLFRRLLAFYSLHLPDCDVVIAHNFPSSIIALRYPRRIIWYVHDALQKEINNYRDRMRRCGILMYVYAYIRSVLVSYLLKRIVYSSGYVIYNSEFVKNDLVSSFGKPRGCMVNYCGVDVESFEPRKPHERYVLVVAPLRKEKRVELSIQVIEFLPPEFRMVICGDGPERDSLEETARAYGIHDRISFKGWVSDDELRDLYSGCFCVLCTAREEDFGLVPIEAMASGKPVVCVNEGGFKETVKNGINGFLTASTERALAEKIVTLIEDQDLYRKMCENARKEATKYSWEKHFETLNRVLKIANAAPLRGNIVLKGRVA